MATVLALSGLVGGNMPVIQPYSQQVLPQGQLQGAQSTPNDFGAQVGAGIEDLGQGAQQLNDSMRAVDEAKGKLIAARSGAQAQLQASTMLMQMQRDPNFAQKYGEDGSGFAEAYKTNFEDYANNLLGQQTNPQARKFLQEQMYEIGDEHFQKAMGVQATVAGAWAGNQATVMTNANTAAARLAPEDAESIATRSNAAWQNMPYMSPQDKIDGAYKDSQAIAQAALEGQILHDPEGFMKTVSPETLAKFKGTPRQTAAMANGTTVNLPNTISGADTVHPYSAAKVMQLSSLYNQPSQYDDMFQQASKITGIPASELKLHAVAESGLDASARNGTGATGLMQLMPDVAKSLGVTNPADPWQSILGGAKLMQQLAQKNGGDQSKMDLAYYGGPSPAQQGPNSQQYAENMAALRSTVLGKENPNSTFQDVLDSLTGAPKEAVKDPTAGWAFNQLSGQAQEKVIQQARTGILQNQTRDLQQAKYNVLLDNAKQKQAMNGAYGALLKNQLTTDAVKNDPVLNNQNKIALTNAIRAEAQRDEKTDPAVTVQTLRDINDGKIKSYSDLLARMGTGSGDLGADKLEMMQKALERRTGVNGEEYGKQDTRAVNQLVQAVSTTSTGLPDPGKSTNAIGIQNDYYRKLQQGIDAGKNADDLRNPKSPDWVGSGLVAKWRPTQQEIMAERQSAYSSQYGTTDAAPKPPPVADGLPLFKDSGKEYTDWINAKTTVKGMQFRTPDGKGGYKIMTVAKE